MVDLTPSCHFTLSSCLLLIACSLSLTLLFHPVRKVNNQEAIQVFHDKLLHAAKLHGPTERPLASYLPYLWWFLWKHTWERKASYSPLRLGKQQGVPRWINRNLVLAVSQLRCAGACWRHGMICELWQEDIWLSDRVELVRWPYLQYLVLRGGSDRSGHVLEHSFSPEVVQHPH